MGGLCCRPCISKAKAVYIDTTGANAPQGRGAMGRNALGLGRAARVIALGSIAMVRPAAADTTLVVGKASPTADTVIAVNVGDRLGFFKNHGIDLKIIDFTG